MTFLEPPENFNPQLSAACCVIECNGEILILQRLATSSLSNQWGVPAGKLEAGETPDEAMVREIKEEAGLEVGTKQLSFVEKLYVRIPRYDLIVYLYRLSFGEKPEARISAEHQAFRWATPQETLKLDRIHDFDECLKIAYPELIK